MLLLPQEPVQSHYLASGADLGHIPVTWGAVPSACSALAGLLALKWLVVADLSLTTTWVVLL